MPRSPLLVVAAAVLMAAVSACGSATSTTSSAGQASPTPSVVYSVEAHRVDPSEALDACAAGPQEDPDTARDLCQTLNLMFYGGAPMDVAVRETLQRRGLPMLRNEATAGGTTFVTAASPTVCVFAEVVTASTGRNDVTVRTVHPDAETAAQGCTGEPAATPGFTPPQGVAVPTSFPPPLSTPMPSPARPGVTLYMTAEPGGTPSR